MCGYCVAKGGVVIAQDDADAAGAVRAVAVLVVTSLPATNGAAAIGLAVHGDADSVAYQYIHKLIRDNGNGGHTTDGPKPDDGSTSPGG